jgi:caffeoyl-CoA O-methyltransferase
MGVLSHHVERYLHGLRPERSALVSEMEELAARDGVPIVEWETARFLATLTRALGPQRVLEVGTAIGFSTLHIAEQLPPGGRIVTLERDEHRIAQARDFLGRAGVLDRVEIVEGDALETLPGLDGPFDMLFLDATKGEYRRYLEIAEEKASERALLLVDNLLMEGEVALEPGEPTTWSAASLAAARELNPELVNSDRWLGSVLPIGDGVGFATRLQLAPDELGR